MKGIRVIYNFFTENPIICPLTAKKPTILELTYYGIIEPKVYSRNIISIVKNMIFLDEFYIKFLRNYIKLKLILVVINMSVFYYKSNIRSLKYEGDLEYYNANFQNAYKYYYQAYKINEEKYKNKNFQNPSIFRRLVLAHYYNGYKDFDLNFLNVLQNDDDLLQDKKYVKIYIKIKAIKGKTPKNQQELYLILGFYYTKAKKYDKAIHFIKLSKKANKSIPYINSLGLAKIYYNIGNLYYKMENINKAQKYYYASREILEKILDHDNPQKIFLKLTDFSYFDQGKPEEIFNEINNLKESDISLVCNYIALIYSELNRINIELSQKVKKFNLSDLCKFIKEKTKCQDSEIALAYYNLGNLYLNLNKTEESCKLYEEFLSKSSDLLDSEHIDKFKIFFTLGNYYYDQKNIYKATFYLEQYKTIIEKSVIPNYNILANTYSRLGDLYYEINDINKCIEVYEQCRIVFGNNLDEDHLVLDKIYKILGEYYFNMNDSKKAIEMNKKIISILDKTNKPCKSEKAQAYYRIGISYEMIGKKKKAFDFLVRLKKMMEGYLLDMNSDYSSIQDSLEQLYKSINEINYTLPLENDGYTCYINTALQILVHLPISYTDLTKDPKLSLALQKLLNCMQKQKKELLKNYMVNFQNVLFEVEKNFKRNTKGDTSILLLTLIKNSISFVKWTRTRTAEHFKGNIKHPIKASDTIDKFQIGKISRGTAQNIKDAIMIKLSEYNFKNEYCSICKTIIVCNGKIKSIIPAQILIISVTDESTFLLKEIETINILNYVFKLKCFTIREKYGAAEDYHIYPICKESDIWNEYNDEMHTIYNKELISNCSLLIYVSINFSMKTINF